MLELVVSGFQSGADIGGVYAAADAAIPTTGWMPRGYLTEEGPRPEYQRLYGARQMPTADYPSRTRANVAMAPLTIWFGSGDSRGYWCTRNAVNKGHRAWWEIGTKGWDELPETMAKNLRLLDYRAVNIAGNRESLCPGICVRVAEYLAEVFRLLKGDSSP